MRRLLAILLLAMSPLAHAVQPDEVLEDPALEQRARALSKELRCLVCQNESIDDSNADLARDLRLVVRERLVAGDSDEQVLDFLVARYGEFVLLTPRFSAANAAIWLAGPALLLIGGAVSLIYLRRRGSRGRADDVPLSADEEAELAAILEDREPRA